MKTIEKPIYRRWPDYIGRTPSQLIGAVWGLGRAQHCIDITLVGDNPMLMAMDAPEIIPTGATYREEMPVENGEIFQAAKVGYAPRDGKPWNNNRWSRTC